MAPFVLANGVNAFCRIYLFPSAMGVRVHVFRWYILPGTLRCLECMHAAPTSDKGDIVQEIKGPSVLCGDHVRLTGSCALLRINT